MTEVTNACAWGLDPGLIQRKAIVKFIRSLPMIKQNLLPVAQDCHICYKPYCKHALCDIPGVRVRCGHIVAALCLCEWLTDHIHCPQCHYKIYSEPDTVQHQHLASLRHSQALRGLLESGNKFLDEVYSSRTSGLGSIYVEGCHAFECWAYTPCHTLGGDSETVRARIHARAHISRWIACTAPDGK